MSYDHITDLIGNTPIIALDRFFPDSAVRVYAKLEGFNPGGSIKDRTSLAMLRRAQERDDIAPGDTITAATAGNTGISLAMLTGPWQYDFVSVTPEDTPPGLVAGMRHFGAKVELTPAAEGMDGAETRAAELARSQGFYQLSEGVDPAPTEAHRRTTAREILLSLGVQLNYFVAGVGTGATFTGVATELGRQLTDVQLIAVEPAASPVLSGGEPGDHSIHGIGTGRVPDLLDTSLLHRIIAVDDDRSAEAVRRLARTEGLSGGPSSGAVLNAMEQIIAERSTPTRRAAALIILPDAGERYARYQPS